MTTEPLYPISYSSTVNEWTPTGSTPFLHDSDGDYISMNATDKVDRNFVFADTTVTNFTYITSVLLQCESRSNVLGCYAHIALSLDGSTFTEKMNAPIDDSDTWIYATPITVTSFFSSLADINNCVARVTSHRGATGIIRVRRVRLDVNYAVPSTGNPNSVQIMAHRREPKLEPRRMPRCQPRNLNVPLFARRF